MITKLTPKQEKQVSVYLKKWLDQGRRTKTTNKTKAKKAVNWYYKAMGLEKPKYVIFLDSPMAVQLACNLIKNTKFDTKPSSQLSSKLSSQLDIQLYIQLDSQLSSQLSSQLDIQLHSQLDSQLYSQLYSQLSSQLYSQLSSQLDIQLRSQLRSQLYSQLDSQLYSQLRSQLSSQLRSQLRSQKLEYFGCTRTNIDYWVGYYGFYDYILNQLFPKKRKEFKILSELCEHTQEIHYLVAFKEICFISDFPKEIHINERGQLNAQDKAAMLYRDTYALYYSNGVKVTKEWAETKPESFTKEMIMKETNADIRRETIRKVGMDRLTKLLDYKVIDKKHGYELINFDVGDGRVRPWLKMVNPSIGTIHIEGVNPGTLSVEDAVKFRNSLSEFSLPATIDGVPFGEGEYHQQGDALFFPIKSIPKEAKIRKDRVAVEGLNRHLASGKDVKVYHGYIAAKSKTAIKHPEHKDTILKGNFQVKQVMEYDHWLEESRIVID